MKGRIIPNRATADELGAKDEPTQRLAELLIQSRISGTTVCRHRRETVIDATNSAFSIVSSGPGATTLSRSWCKLHVQALNRDARHPPAPLTRPVPTS